MENLLSSLGQDISVAVIGSSGTIGSAFVQHLQKAPSVKRIYSLSRSQIDLKGDKVVPLSIDILEEVSIAEVADKISEPLHLVVMATGMLHGDDGLKPEKSIRDFRPDYFARVFAVNSTGPAMVARYFLPKMIRHQKSVFGVLSARVGSITDNQLGGWYAYRASKAALNMIIKSLAIETHRSNKEAVVIALHPGTVDSDLSRPFQSSVPKGKLFTSDFATERLLRVMDQLTPEDTGCLFDWSGEQLQF